MKKVALFVFREDLMCFIHVLLNALDMKEKGYDIKIVIEGAATKLIPQLSQEGNPMSTQYKKVKEKKLIDGVCRACSTKMKVLKDVEREGLPLADEMHGHPAFSRYINEGYQIINF
ncbi:MAG: DsrE family protein [Thermodesulfobacteriota bacterium]|nr:DsrE family protein [Thermodesulfobacteriota bacterium]